ncbi:protein charybde-like [Schistocerca cancellata]|uniref:protein charybde-like n=1 Tax=Schistocerca cancellata TaxID=274614 RepID=UPI002119B60E|nr:protein charybde-like [Schistocerca cancellata]
MVKIRIAPPTPSGKMTEVLPCPLSVDFSCFYDGEKELALEMDAVCAKARDALAKRLESELRASHAGRFRFALPPTLLSDVADTVLQLASAEPYGIRGCRLHVDLETGKQAGADQSQQRLRLATFKCAPDTVSTFEVFVTLRQETSWKVALPHILKNLTSGGVVVLSQDFTIAKKSLFRSYSG